jgi:hypothetical protein
MTAVSSQASGAQRRLRVGKIMDSKIIYLGKLGGRVHFLSFFDTSGQAALRIVAPFGSATVLLT